jgi:hypothetical protein
MLLKTALASVLAFRYGEMMALQKHLFSMNGDRRELRRVT